MEENLQKKGPTVPPLRELARNIGLTKNQYAELLRLFVDTSCKDLDQIRQALGAGDLKAGAEAAHSLKGAAIGLGLTAIHQRARLLEKSLGLGNLNQAQWELHHLHADINKYSDFKGSDTNASSE